MGLWEFMAATDGLRVFHGGKPARGTAPDLDDDRLAELGIEGFDEW
jgi:hypothetical protein